MDPKTLDHIRVYEMYRRRIVEEDGLINDRMTWLILSEAFLFASFGALINLSSKGPILVVIPIVVLLGIYISYVSQKAINAARKEIEYLDSHFKRNNSNVVQDYRILKLIGEEGRHEVGHQLPNHLPNIIMFLWIIILISPFLYKIKLINDVTALVSLHFSQ